MFSVNVDDVTVHAACKSPGRIEPAVYMGLRKKEKKVVSLPGTVKFSGPERYDIFCWLLG